MNEENNTSSIYNTDNIENSNENDVSNEVVNTSSDIENNTTNETTTDNTTTYTEQQENVISIQDIHNDLGIITSFLIFFVLVILLKYVYKFFDMFFVI